MTLCPFHLFRHNFSPFSISNNLKLAQTVLTFLFVSPFTFSFLLLAKASTIKGVDHKKCAFSSLLNPLFITQLCNSLVMLAANATCFFFLVVCFNFLDVLGFSSSQALIALMFSATGAIIYSMILAHAYIICNLALVSSGMEKQGGLITILKACVMIQGKNTTALSLAVLMNLALAAIEALFQYRIVTAYNNRHDLAPNSALLVMEGSFIAYLYGVFLVLDTVVGCVFWKRCKRDHQFDHLDEICFHQMEFQERDGKSFANTNKALDMILP